MGLRIHFTYEDLTRVVLADAPDPLWEALLSLHLLQNRDGPLVFGRWRRAAAERPAEPALLRLRTLAPPVGYSADFLTPAEASLGLEAGIDALLSTPRARLRTDLTELAHARRLPGWVRPLADGDPQALHGTAGLLRRHHELFVAPYWTHIRAQFEAERSTAARTLLQNGFAAMVQGLHPTIRWMPPVLEAGGPHLDGDLHLNGRGLRIIPSFFCWPGPIVLRDETLPPVLVHPLSHDPRWLGPSAYGAGGGSGGSAGGSPHRALAALVGRARAAVLEAVADGLTTTELARRAGISPATVSHHTAVLREAGLIISRRLGGAVLHTLTPMGAELLGGPPASRIGAPSKCVVHADSAERR